MTITEMKNSIVNIYGLENDVTIMFFSYCENHTEKEISSYYTMCLAIPVYDDDE
jgi:hypothetical protein